MYVKLSVWKRVWTMIAYRLIKILTQFAVANFFAYNLIQIVYNLMGSRHRQKYRRFK